MKTIIQISCSLLMLTIAFPVQAQQEGPPKKHEGDLEFIYDNGKIDILNGEEGHQDAVRVFESDMPDFGLFQGFTDEPGFISEIDLGLGIEPFDVIDYEVLESRFGQFLHYYNPAVGDLESTTTTLTIRDNPIGSLIVTETSGGTGPGAIGQANGDGDFHWHIDFMIPPSSPFGAYAILLSLNTTAEGVDDSAPFYIVFAYGITEEEHEEAVEFFQGKKKGVLKGDVNQDGVVNLQDINPFVSVLTSGDFMAEADCNCDGVVNLQDVSAFIDILNGG